jgi:hypothetical protein
VLDGTPSLWIFDLLAKTKKGATKAKQLLRYDFPEEVASSKVSVFKFMRLMWRAKLGCGWLIA